MTICCEQEAGELMVRAISEEQACRGLVIARGRAMARKRIIRRHDKYRDKAETMFMAAIKPVLEKAKSQMLAKARAKVKASRLNSPVSVIKAATTPVAVDLMFSLDEFGAQFMAAVRDTYHDAIQVCGTGALDALGVDKEFVSGVGVVEKFIIRRENLVKGVPENIYDQIKRGVTEGYTSGMTEDEVAESIEGVFDQVYKGRARTVARTESQSVYGLSQHSAIQQAGFEYKRWLTSHDDRVRDSHQECEMEGAIGVDEEFENGLMYPGDPAEDDPAEVCNCRCVLLSADGPEDDE